MNIGRVQVARDGSDRSRETIDGARILPARVFLTIFLCGVLVAGLWPFRAPANQVSWSTDGDGVEFGRHGTAVSQGKCALRAGQDESAGSVEAWFERRGMAHWNSLLSFDSKEHPCGPFKLVQRADALVVERYNIDAHDVCRTMQFAVRNALKSGRRVHVTIVLSAHHALVYVNGALAVDSYLIGDSGHNLTGRLVLANSTDIDNSWRGEVLGLAVYPKRLSAGQIARDHKEWTGRSGPKSAADETPLALYRFDEHQGRVAHNAADRATDLVFPERYFVLHPRFLAPAWIPFRYG